MLPPINNARSPLFEAQNSSRYERQALIADYEQRSNCRLIVMIGEIFYSGVTILEDIIHDADPGEDLHLMLASPGGDGESAVRLARSKDATHPTCWAARPNPHNPPLTAIPRFG